MKFLFLLLPLFIFSSCTQETQEQEVITPFVTVVDCKECGGEQLIQQLQTQIPHLEHSVVEEGSLEANILIEKFSPRFFPFYVFNEGIKNTDLKEYISSLFEEKDKEFLFFPERANLSSPVKKLIKELPINDFDYRISGTKDSAIQIFEISEAECPFCKKFHNETFYKFEEKYGKQVSFRFKNYPLPYHTEALPFAQAFQCAGRFEIFPEFLSLAFSQETTNAKEIPTFLHSLQKDETEFFACMKEESIQKELEKQQQDIENILGEIGTPSFVINGKYLISGAYPFETFSSLIDSLVLSSSMPL
jgi:protein-disulfide isomerase